MPPTTTSPRHHISQSFALPPATKPVSHLPCPLPPCHRVTAPLHHHVTALVSHLPCPLPPNQSVICLAPYHCVTASLRHRVTAPPRHHISQSFALSPATKPVSHLPCPLPPNQSVICLAPYHRVTASPCHHVTVSPRHRMSQSFALPPATKSVSHLPCPVPPNQSVICLAPTTASPCHCITAPLHHCVTTSPHHCITVPPHHCVTASPRHRVTALVSHLPCPLPPSQSVICLAPCHQTSQSFALPPTTASPRHCISAPLHHHITALVSHLPCPLPPSQSVICLAPCHQTSQSFALPLPPHHRVTASPHHCITASPHHRITASPCHHTTVSPHHRATASLH